MTIIRPKRIGIVSKGRQEDLGILQQLIHAVEEHVELILDETSANLLKRTGEPLAEMTVVDLIVSVGGDGTILRTLHAVPRPVPIIGINTGAIGFLAEVQPEEGVETLRRLLAGFEVELRERLAIALDRVSETVPYAMNEAVLITSKPGKMLHFAIRIDGVELEQLRADGVICATPTGSTAYAMSAGGPIVDPRVNATIIVPIAPFKLAARPTVVDIRSEIALELIDLKPAELVIDGQFYRPIGKDERITITRGEPARFVRVRDQHFLKLRDKLRGAERKG